MKTTLTPFEIDIYINLLSKKEIYIHEIISIHKSTYRIITRRLNNLSIKLKNENIPFFQNSFKIWFENGFSYPQIENFYDHYKNILHFSCCVAALSPKKDYSQNIEQFYFSSSSFSKKSKQIFGNYSPYVIEKNERLTIILTNLYPYYVVDYEDNFIDCLNLFTKQKKIETPLLIKHAIQIAEKIKVKSGISRFLILNVLYFIIILDYELPEQDKPRLELWNDMKNKLQLEEKQLNTLYFFILKYTDYDKKHAFKNYTIKGLENYSQNDSLLDTYCGGIFCDVLIKEHSIRSLQELEAKLIETDSIHRSDNDLLLQSKYKISTTKDFINIDKRDVNFDQYSFTLKTKYFQLFIKESQTTTLKLINIKSSDQIINGQRFNFLLEINFHEQENISEIFELLRGFNVKVFEGKTGKVNFVLYHYKKDYITSIYRFKTNYPNITINNIIYYHDFCNRYLDFKDHYNFSFIYSKYYSKYSLKSLPCKDIFGNYIIK